MKINIDYKLFRKIITNRKAYTIFLTFFIGIEFFTFLQIKNKPKEPENAITKEKREIRLDEAIQELKEREIPFLTAKKENETYLIDVKVEGSKEIVLKKIGELVNYKISDFNIDFYDNVITGKVTLKYSPKGEF